MSSIRSIAAALLYAIIVVLPPALSAQQPDREQYSAILSNISNAGGVGITPVTIRLNRLTSDEQHIRLMNILEQKGQDAFLRALVDQEPVGSIAAPASLKYDFFYARAEPTKEGGRQIIMITDRPMTFAERVSSARSADYPFTVVQMTLDEEGRGEGTLAQLVQLRRVGEFLAVENLATAPMNLREIKKQR